MASRPPPLPTSAPALKISPTKIAAALGGVLVLVGVFSSYYQVPPTSVAVVQRLGKFLEITQPGLHFKLPFGVDTYQVVETRRQMKLEFGYSTPGATNPYQFSRYQDEQDNEKNMVTGDLNAAVVEWAVQFHIHDAQAYVFNYKEPQRTLRDLSEAVMREVVGDRTIDEVLTIGRQEIEVKALQRLQASADNLGLGVQVNAVQLGNVNPPAEVKDSFNEVNRSQQEKESMVNQANGEYNRVVPRAKGEAEQRISEAEGYATKRVNEAEGDAARFTALLAEYEKAPEVTKMRIYLETLSEVLPYVPGKTIVDEKVPQFLPMMQLKQNTAPPQPSTPAATR